MAEQRIPPQNLEAEQSVIGAILIDKDAIFRVAEFLRPEHFYKEGHHLIFQAILDLFGAVFSQLFLIHQNIIPPKFQTH